MNINTIQNNLFYGIVSRKEVEYILNNEKENVLKKILLISIINPSNDRTLLEEAKKELNSKEDTYEIPIQMMNGKIKKILGSKKELEKFIENLELKIELNRKDPNKIEDYNSFPITKNLLEKVFDNITVEFWDIEEKIANYQPISEKEAKKIAKFIKKYKDKIGKDLQVLIHCSAGISRSAGTGMAVKCIVEHDGDKYDFSMFPCGITQMRRYSPNLVVMDKIIEEYNKLKRNK